MSQSNPCPFCGNNMTEKAEGEPGLENWWYECSSCGAVCYPSDSAIKEEV